MLLLKKISKFDILKDSKFPKPVQHSIFSDLKHNDNLFWLGGGLVPRARDGDSAIHMITDKGVCRAAPGFAQVC